MRNEIWAAKFEKKNGKIGRQDGIRSLFYAAGPKREVGV